MKLFLDIILVSFPILFNEGNPLRDTLLQADLYQSVSRYLFSQLSELK